MKKKRICMALAAALSLSLAVSATALAAIPSDIGGHWAQGTIIQWTTNGYISGYPDGTFKPDNSITRAEFVVMVNKAMGYNKRGNAYFSDVSAAHWAYAEIMKGVEAGYITGNGDGTFRPDAPVTRQEAAVMISKILGLDQDYASAAKYVDYRYIPSWAAGYVGAVSKAGIMTGYPDGDFKSDRVLTRAESVVSLDKTKNYDGKAEEDKDDREVFEDYRLTSSSLSDKIIKGDLIISSSLSNRNVSLDNVKVEGKLIVEGGKTVTADDCEISELEMNRSDVEFDATGRTKVGKTTFEKYGKLSGSGYSRVIIDDEFNSYIELNANIDYVELDADTNVRLLENCAIETFEATKNADSATVNFNKAEVEDMDIYDAIRITGRGDINNMTVYKSGVKSSIRPDHLDTRNGASKPDYTSTSSGDVGYNPGSRYDDLTASRDDKTYRGGKYDDVRVTGEDVNLKDMTIYGNLTIDEDVRNSDIELRDLDIRGNVYIYGGGQSTVGFYDCEIEGNIYARKDYDNTPVGLYIDGDTVENFDGDLYIDDDGAILETGGKLDKVYVLTGAEVKVDTNVKNLYVSAKTNNLKITAGTTVDKLSISSSSAKDSTITNYGTINELNTSQDIKVDGSGTIKEKTGNGTVTTGDGQKISVTGVSLNKTATTIEVDKTEKLTATVTPDNATNKNVTWKSSNEDVATVGTDGTVTAKAVGTADITVTTEDGSKTAKCTVTVKEATTEIEVTGITISDGTEGSEEKTLKVGNTLSLTANINPSNATNQNITWSVSDDKDDVDVVTLSSTTDKEITVTANAVGAATVTVKTADGKHTDSYKVTVEAATVEITKLEFEKDTEEITVGDEPLQLKVMIEPSNATEKTLIWDSSNTQYATVDQNGNVTAVAEGTTTITVKTSDGKFSDTCEVTVKAATVPVMGVTIYDSTGQSEAGTTAEINAGESITFTAKVSPDTATDKGVTWESSDDSVATVSNGTVTAANVTEQKTVTITAKSVSNEEESDSITITVKPVAVTGIQLNQSSVELTGINSSTTLTATVTPDNAANKEVTWSVSGDTSAVELSKNQSTSGESITVTAKASGTATITATSNANSEVKATCEVTVTVPVTGVTITAPQGTTSPATLTPGGTLQLTANVTPAGADYGQIIWESSDTSAATVANGLVTAQQVTETKIVTITAKVDETHSATFQITVQASTPPTPGDGNTGTGGTGDDNGGGNYPKTGGAPENGNQTETGGVTENGNQPGGTTTQATNNAIVVSR